MPADNGDGGGGGDDGPPPWAGQHKNGSWPSNAPWFPNKQPFWSSSSSSFPAGVSPTPTPFGGGLNSAADKDAPSKLGHGGLMAAVIVPVVLVLLSVVGVVFLLARRRRRRGGYAFNNSSEPKPPLSSLEMASTSSSSNIINETREYRRPPSPPPQLPPPQTLPNNLHAPAPIIISTSRNNAYLTGLDTGSEGSQSRPVSGDFDDNLIRRSFGGTFAEPPPPYVPKGQGDDAPPRDEYFVSPIEGMGAFGRERVQSPFGDEHAFMDEEDMGMADGMQYRRDPFEDPESPVSEAGGLREGVRPSGMREL